MPLSLRRALASVLTLALAALGAAPATAAPVGPPPLTAQPSSLDFGVVPVDWGEQSSSIWIQNDGPDPLQPGSASIAGSPSYRVSSDGCSGQTLTSGQGCGVSVGFDPVDGSVSDGALHVPVPGWDDFELPLHGVGGVQQVTLEPQALAFGAVAVGADATRALTLTSTGTLPFQSFVALPTGGDVGAFRVERDGCSLQQLAPGQPCTISVRFAPLAAGEATATLLLIGGANEPAAVPLHGSGVLAASPSSAQSPADGATAAAAAAAAAAPRAAADVVFDAPTGLPARVKHGRIDLGRVHCKATARCVVTVRSRVFAVAAGGGRITSIRGDAVQWRLRDGGARATLVLPPRLHGRPSLLVVRLRTRAEGHSAGTRIHVVRLVSAHRR